MIGPLAGIAVFVLLVVTAVAAIQRERYLIAAEALTLAVTSWVSSMTAGWPP